MKNDTISSKNKKCLITYLLLGLTSLTLGILSITNDYQDIVLYERMRLRPWLPAYEMWTHPSASDIDIGIKTYFFAVENPHEFLTNKTAKLKLKEIGPAVYKKITRQENIQFHDEDSTMTFTTVFDLVFDEERSPPGILNQTITVANPMLLGLASLASDIFLARMALKMIAQEDEIFINRTVYQMLWNNTSPIFEFVKKIPFAAPRQNGGTMYNFFYPGENTFNVNIGPKHGFKNFFTINTFNGLPRIDAYEENYPKHCPVSLIGASEGTGLPPHIKKDDVIYLYQKNLCRTYPLVYNNTVEINGIKAYRLVTGEEVYSRLKNPKLDCFKQTNNVPLPDGLSDVSKCALGLPVAASPPHFWGFKGEWENYIEGLAPNEENHATFATVEPTSGVQLEGVARLQSNLPLPTFDDYSPSLNRFSNMILPQFWMEYFVINKSPIIYGLLKTFLLLPIIQPICVICLVIFSVFAFYKSIRIIYYQNDLNGLKLQPELAILREPLYVEKNTKPTVN